MDDIQTTADESADLKDAICSPPTGASDIFCLSYVQLCGISYDVHINGIPHAVAAPGNVETWSPQGQWSCVWGPVLDEHEANLVYVAAYHSAPGGAPTAFVVVVRGTDVTDDVWGDFKEAFEDLAGWRQETPPWLSDPGILVSEGVLDALTTVTGLRWNGETVAGFLARQLGADSSRNPVVVVTGHSLGGCVTTVLAPWLLTSLTAAGKPARMVPATFAAPTAGNHAYADYLNRTFPYAPRYYTDLDAVPRGWAQLDSIKSIYDAQGLSTPWVVDGTIDGFLWLLGEYGATYTQPRGARPLTGVFCNGLSWYEQIGAQHDHNNYILQLKGELPTCPVSARPRNRRWTPEERAAALAAEKAAGCDDSAGAPAEPPPRA
ncbi:MAG TPA: lipase family protein [Allosphingosinicella sp.]|nr:lipase family protein [Allosphingosinicella sp.]